jgi:hypothetical protein
MERREPIAIFDVAELALCETVVNFDWKPERIREWSRTVERTFEWTA